MATIVSKSRKKSTAGQKDDRQRNWTCIVYPDSAPTNWREILDEEHMPWAESPLHDKDVNADGTPKKPHWHVLMTFEGKKSFEQMKAITDKINAPIPKAVQSVKAMTRYMAHLDNPEKAQYPVSKIIAHGGFDLADALRATASSRYELIAEMIDFITKEKYTEFIDFMNYCKDHRYDDWFPIMCDSGAFLIDKVLKSNRFKSKPEAKADGSSEVVRLTDEALQDE